MYNNELSKMNCISRKDDKDKNLFVAKTDRKSRWNLYSQIAIENNKLLCSKEVYNLTDICNENSRNVEQPCTLMGTNEVVDISIDGFS